MSILIENIEKDIENKKGRIKTENVIISIGEIINLYKDKDIKLNPDFQRFFRWTKEQKSRLIESIFLGLPIPSFFVYEDNQNIWEVLDGLQRISSILEYIGELKNEENKAKEPLVLEGMQYLTSLEGTKWSDLSDKLQRGFKKNTLPFIVMKNETSEIKKYQLFQRLNRGGTTLTEAEVRNCIILMEPQGKALINMIDTMYNNVDFQNTVCLNERKKNEKADFDLVIRYLCFKYSTIDELLAVKSVGDFLNNKISKLAYEGLNYKNEIEYFEYIFKQINLQLSKKAFRKWDTETLKPVGPFLMAQYEAVIYGILKSENCSNLNNKLDYLISHDIYKEYSKGGIAVQGRWSNILELARSIFENE
ncbi:MAG: DUF262 domain-containing protein [Candidatus Gastranaerophilales bacterium]|nr:DUF262 domain-containing protein [Candidatus Gastranaerophilales bacterium]